MLGAVDGTLIKIQAPSENEPSYVCRKGFHALNVQAVSDASLRFIDLVCKWPGAVNDSFVFEKKFKPELHLGSRVQWMASRRFRLSFEVILDDTT